jgi:hypothetical protein
LDGGYRFTITNYDPAQSYAFVQAGGATVTRNGDTLTVSGLAAGVTSVTTVTVSNPGYVDASATETGSSLPNGQAPVASAVTRTDDGFSFTITLVPGTSYLVTSGAGTVTLSGSTVTVTGSARRRLDHGARHGVDAGRAGRLDGCLGVRAIGRGPACVQRTGRDA